ncbi:MAG: SusC/RagA family TonB-linked outer membrane protein [Longimicrobiaceae bacterium]
MKKLGWLLAVGLAIAAVPGQLLAQATGTITGRVTDSQQQPIAGAQVIVVNGPSRTVTGQDGSYRIPGVRTGSVQVSATRIGYDTRVQTVAVAAGATATADFTLASSALEIGGLVVTASGREQRQRELGNAIGTISAQDVEMASVPTTTNLLQGRSPGVTVTQNSGTAGAAQRIRIRGANSVSLSNEPLLVIDGVRATLTDNFTNVATWQSPSRLNDINPEDIENVEILKGPAAAALYGTAAANGVIQITTKRGRAGRPRWNLNVERSEIRDVTEYPASFSADRVPALSDQCRTFYVAEGLCTITGVKSFSPLEDPSTTVLRDGFRNQYGLSVSGGSESTTYYVAGEVQDEQGVIDLNTLDQASFRANLTTRPTDKLNLSVKTGYVNTGMQFPDNDNSLNGFMLNGLLGSSDSTVNQGYYAVPPDEMMEFNYGQESNRVTGSVNADFRPLGWLSLVATGGLDQVNRHDFELVEPNRVFNSFSANAPFGWRRSNRVQVSNFTGTVDGTATFPLLENLSSTTSVGTQYHRELYRDNRAYGVGLAPGTKSLQGTSRLFTVSENTTDNITLGAYVQQQFAWNDRLYLTAAIRGDENSAFGDEAGFITYPSVSGSWVVSEEPFFPQADFLSNLRLRAAYGRSGLRPSFRDAITYFAPVSVRVGGSEIPAVALATGGTNTGGTGNERLRPEIASEIELGFESGFLEDRVGFELTYYNKTSKDALVRVPIPSSFGLTTNRFDNIGEVRNSGFEASLNANVLDRSNFQWDFTLTGSTNKNELLTLGEGIDPIYVTGPGRTTQRHLPGYSLGGYWQRRVEYQDLNGDGLLQALACLDGAEYGQAGCEVMVGDSLEYIGTPLPTREASFTTNFTLFNLVKVSGLLDYKGGHKQLNFTRFDRCAWEALCESVFNPDAAPLRDQAGFIAYNYLEPNVNTYVFHEDADFVKLRELSVSLMLPERFAQRFGGSGLRLTVSGRNLKTWTDYTGFDPEVNGYGVFSGNGGFSNYEYYTQPPLRYYTARVDVNF